VVGDKMKVSELIELLEPYKKYNIEDCYFGQGYHWRLTGVYAQNRDSNNDTRLHLMFIRINND
jgi:hypothetical protein